MEGGALEGLPRLTVTQPPTGKAKGTRRRRSTAAELEQLDRQIIEILETDNPQSVRHVFYRLTDPRLEVSVPKTERGYEQVQRRCLKLRRGERLPYRWISDATRRAYHVNTFEGPGDFLNQVASLYRANIWSEETANVEVWCESRSIAGVLQTECQRLAVSLYPCGGFSSATLGYEAAEQINRAGRPAAVLYVGDYDPAGLLIDQALERELREHLEVELEFRRLAINQEQIEAFDLPTKPRKASDRRRLDVQETVEAEAMPAADLRRLVREAVESYLPPRALEVAKAAEESEREAIRLLGEELEYGGVSIHDLLA